MLYLLRLPLQMGRTHNLSCCLRALTFDTCNFLAPAVHFLWQELDWNLIVLVNIHHNFAWMWVVRTHSFTYFISVLKPAACGRAWRFAWPLSISVIKLCRLVKGRAEREIPKPRSSKSATTFLRSLCKVLKYTCWYVKYRE